MIKVIINADDFGYSSEINKAIVDSLDNKQITSTTLIANMEGFNDAIHLIKKHNLFDKVGLHINLTEGVPLTEEIKTCSRFCDNRGNFLKKRNSLLDLIYPLSSIERSAITSEIEAQLSRITQYRLKITHVDSHYHKHTEPHILPIILSILSKHQIRILRGSKIVPNKVISIYRPLILFKILYKMYVNYLIQSKLGVRVHFISIDDLANLSQSQIQKMKYGLVEIMVHPIYYQGTLLDQDFKNNYKIDDLKKLISLSFPYNVEFISPIQNID